MIIYIREGDFFNYDELIHILKLKKGIEQSFISDLLKYHILKQKRHQLENINNLDDETLSNENFFNTTTTKNVIYTFTYVGVIKKADKIIICYPKYMAVQSTDMCKTAKLKTIFKVLQKYNHSKAQSIKLYEDPTFEGSSNFLGLILYLLQDYFDYGLYSNEKDMIETNGKGRILWNKTITHTQPFIQHSQPYYFKLKTKKRTLDENNFFKKLHQCILTQCSNFLGELSDLFCIPKIELTTETMTDLGDIDILRYMINKELHIQFYTRKIHLLKAMLAFINQDQQTNKYDSFYTYGTNNFNLVWEDVCKKTLENQLTTQLYKILSVIPNDFNRNDRLIDLIKKATWTGNQLYFVSKETLEPDIINIKTTNNEICFNIYDAKYYKITVENSNVKGYPGIQDITKQYLYQLAYQKFITALKKQGVTVTVKNYFVLPKEKNDTPAINKVKLDFLSSIGLKDIDVKYIEDQKIYLAYLKNMYLDNI